MRYFYFLLSIFVMTFSWSCNSPITSENGSATATLKEDVSPVDVLYKEVMKIHDDVMPKVRDIHRLQKQLEIQLKVTNEIPKEKIQAVLNQLAAADKGMWDWMKLFRQPDKNLPQDSILQYLQKEKETISKVSDDMINSIAAGNGIIEKLKE